MIDLLVAGGWVMPLIVACSVVALSISIERYIALDRSKVAPPHLLATVWRDLKQGELNAQKLAQLWGQGMRMHSLVAFQRRF